MGLIATISIIICCLLYIFIVIQNVVELIVIMLSVAVPSIRVSSWPCTHILNKGEVADNDKHTSFLNIALITNVINTKRCINYICKIDI
jgi:hypothetical protein